MAEICFDCEENPAVKTCPYCTRKFCTDCADECDGTYFCNDEKCSTEHYKLKHCKYCGSHKCDIDECERCGKEHCNYKDDCSCIHQHLSEKEVPAEIDRFDDKSYEFRKQFNCDNCEESIELYGNLRRVEQT